MSNRFRPLGAQPADLVDRVDLAQILGQRLSHGRATCLDVFERREQSFPCLDDGDVDARQMLSGPVDDRAHRNLGHGVLLKQISREAAVMPPLHRRAILAPGLAPRPRSRTEILEVEGPVPNDRGVVFGHALIETVMYLAVAPPMTEEEHMMMVIDGRYDEDHAVAATRVTRHQADEWQDPSGPSQIRAPIGRISSTAASLVCFFCFAISRHSSGSSGPRDMSLRSWLLESESC